MRFFELFFVPLHAKRASLLTLGHQCKHHGPRLTADLSAKSVRVCSRSAINALQRHTLHLQVREASWPSLNRRLVSPKAAKRQTDNNRQFKEIIQIMATTDYKQRTREEVMAWLQKARERKDAFQKRANEIFAEEDRLRQQAADSHYYDIAVK